jgi:chromosome segregation ATPase
MNPLQSLGRALTLPPELLSRALDDLHDIARLARLLVGLEEAIMRLVAAVEVELADVRGALSDLERVRASVESLNAQIVALAELPALRDNILTLQGQLRGVQESLAPVADIRALRATLEEIPQHVDGLEPMIERVSQSIHDLHPKLDEVRDAVEPLGDLAERIPGARRRSRD